ncbi:Similar to ankyrin [Exophiala dermatitidis NIH/UT8656]; acc. no. EHY59712 [Pyronema omphalodes CBS 100304]|uniref:Similar to ankyrin [Exophiala dermatitidis NIH/UT8656] acc. no. EHY59712 n=1 Tax=Pyronema omphalodes (strain CBS 100304) TaxID=1076935 RepID=U4LI55_PYROM|nr:Similar to ankyrin [Exophiala dermatitidis NIH/UT8656]; acc. no. EHY59712 [Pyronema omphalodes CBS 100304]
MSDPLSMLASIAGLVGFSIEITKTLTAFVTSVKSAPKEASQLTTEVSALRHVLEILTPVLKADDFKNHTFDEESILCSIIVACEENIALIYAKTTKLRNASKITGIILARLLWPFKREECLESIQTLHRYVQTLQVLLIASNRQTSTAVMEKLEEQHKSVIDAITDLAASSGAVMNKIAVSVEKVQDMLENAELDKVIQSLSPLEPHKRHQDIKSKRLEDNGKWFLDTPEFKTYSLVIDYLSAKYSSHRSRFCLVYVYCDYRDEKNQTAVHLIGALLKQVLAKHSRHLPQEFIDSLKKQKNDTNAGSLSFTRETQLLRDVLQRFERFYVCIDALDECKEEHRKDLVAAIKPLLEHSETTAHLFVTGRSHMQSQVEKALPVLPLTIIIRASAGDIRRYVARQLEKDENYDDMDEEFRSEIMEKIVNTADGMLLLPALQIQSVLEQTSIADRKAALDKMPEKLDAAFRVTIDRIERQTPARSKLGMRVLKWTFLALRQLKTIELRHAFATIDCTSDTLDLDALPFEKFLTECCYGLVIIDKEISLIRLVHKSLHDYLKQKYEAEKVFMDGHCEIARTCLVYMGFRIDKNDWDIVKHYDTVHSLIY